MRTDDLISLMSASTGPIDSGRLPRATWLAALAGLVVATALILLTIGARHDLSTAWLSPPVLAKVGLGAGAAIIGLIVFQRSLRPGLRPSRLLWLTGLPLALAATWAALTLANAPAEQWNALIFGKNWSFCLIALPLYALCPMPLLIAVARIGAPIDPRLTGLCAGLGSAGLAIMAYAIHCPDDTPPFLATWYTLAIVIIAGLCALLLPRFLRW